MSSWDGSQRTQHIIMLGKWRMGTRPQRSCVHRLLKLACVLQQISELCIPDGDFKMVNIIAIGSSFGVFGFVLLISTTVGMAIVLKIKGTLQSSSHIIMTLYSSRFIQKETTVCRSCTCHTVQLCCHTLTSC